tara:strand:+ start:143 stop:247 length:105 start_codon:yes stop_codon:yes gene_type:complete
VGEQSPILLKGGLMKKIKKFFKKWWKKITGGYLK